MSTAIIPQLSGERIRSFPRSDIASHHLLYFGHCIRPDGILRRVYGHQIGRSWSHFFSLECSHCGCAFYASHFGFRFIAGFCRCPQWCLAEEFLLIYGPAERGMALGFYAFVANGHLFGPTISSLFGTTFGQSVSWRNPQYFCGLFNFLSFLSFAR